MNYEGSQGGNSGPQNSGPGNSWEKPEGQASFWDFI